MHHSILKILTASPTCVSSCSNQKQATKDTGEYSVVLILLKNSRVTCSTSRMSSLDAAERGIS